jgi:hypothetical protein
MIKELIKRLQEMGAASESDTERDGAFSYSGETHGFAVGLYYGFVDFRDWGGLPEGYAEGKNIEKGWYPKAGYVVGALVRVLCYLLIGGILFSQV